jgi:hypothetical protein
LVLKILTKADFKREIKKYYRGKINKTQVDRILNYIWMKKDALKILMMDFLMIYLGMD